jgi:hypothetical protein
LNDTFDAVIINDPKFLAMNLDPRPSVGADKDEIADFA